MKVVASIYLGLGILIVFAGFGAALLPDVIPQYLGTAVTIIALGLIYILEAKRELEK
jgi:hypothetical protein